MLMHAVRTNGGTRARLAAIKPRRRTRLLMACAAIACVLLIFVGIRAVVQRNLPYGDGSLAAIGVTSAVPTEPAPRAAFADAGGRLLTLRDFNGRAVVLNLWATWCVPCRREMPSLDRLQAKLGGPHFQVIAVSIDKQGLAVVQPFYRELGLRSLGIYLDMSGKAPSVLGVEGLPATLLINEDGREIGRKLGALEWDDPAVIDVLRKVFELTDLRPSMPTTSVERKSP